MNKRVNIHKNIQRAGSGQVKVRKKLALKEKNMDKFTENTKMVLIFGKKYA